MTRCACGQRMSKYASVCRACHAASMRRSAEQYTVAAQRGTCPIHPDMRLITNNALAGCEADAYRALVAVQA